jgi:hypothetical protein
MKDQMLPSTARKGLMCKNQKEKNQTGHRWEYEAKNLTDNNYRLFGT